MWDSTFVVIHVEGKKPSFMKDIKFLFNRYCMVVGALVKTFEHQLLSFFTGKTPRQIEW